MLSIPFFSFLFKDRAGLSGKVFWGLAASRDHSWCSVNTAGQVTSPWASLVNQCQVSWELKGRGTCPWGGRLTIYPKIILDYLPWAWHSAKCLGYDGGQRKALGLLKLTLWGEMQTKKARELRWKWGRVRILKVARIRLLGGQGWTL